MIFGIFHAFYFDYAKPVFNRLVHFKMDSFDLTVVLKEPGTLQGINQSLPANIIEGTPSPVRRIEFAAHCNRAFYPLCAGLLSYGRYNLTVLSAVTGDENSRSHVTVIVVYAWWPRQFEFEHHIHGGLLGTRAGWAVVGIAGAGFGSGL